MASPSPCASPSACPQPVPHDPPRRPSAPAPVSRVVSHEAAPPWQTLPLAYKKRGRRCPIPAPVPPRSHGELPAVRQHQHAALRQEHGGCPGHRLRPHGHHLRPAGLCPQPSRLCAVVLLQHLVLQRLLPGLRRTFLLHQGQGQENRAGPGGRRWLREDSQESEHRSGLPGRHRHHHRHRAGGHHQPDHCSDQATLLRHRGLAFPSSPLRSSQTHALC